MSDALRVGVIGGGLIAQAVHVPNLVALADRFSVAAIADPSPAVTAAIAARFGPMARYQDWRDLLDSERVDALVVCSPHATHAAIVLAALERGVHAFVEKPLCVTPADGAAIAAAAAGLVVQVGYMKRYARAYERFADGLPSAAAGLRAIDVMTYDPWMAREPFVPWSRMTAAADVPADVLARAAREEARQVGEAVGADDPDTIRAYSSTFLGCLVHDINLVHGVLERLGIAADPVGSACWAGGDAASATLRLPGGGEARSAWMLLRGLLDFRERIEVLFDDQIHTLTFPAPYLVQSPVRRAVVTAAAGAHREAVEHHVHDPYLAELEHFHHCVTTGAPCRTPPEQATADITALRDLFLLRRP